MSQTSPREAQALLRIEPTEGLDFGNAEIDVFRLGDVLAKSKYFDDAKEAAQCVVKVLAGRELGFGPIASMAGVYIINGKPSLAANLMAAAIKRSGKYNYRVRQMDSQVCEIEFFEQGQPIGVSTFSEQDAKVAGALDGPNKHTWKKFPRNMLFARAMSNGARWFTPDIFGGPVFTPEELHAPVNEEGAYINTAAAPVRQLQSAPAAASSTDTKADEQRNTLVKEIFDICALLNGAGVMAKDAQGRPSKWTSVTLKIFVNEEFEVEDGLESLSFDYLKKLQGILTLKLPTGQA